MVEDDLKEELNDLKTILKKLFPGRKTEKHTLSKDFPKAFLGLWKDHNFIWNVWNFVLFVLL